MLVTDMNYGKGEQMEVEMYEQVDSRKEQVQVQCRDADSSCWKGCGEQNNNK